MKIYYINIKNKKYIKIRKKIINNNYLNKYINKNNILFNYNRIYILNNLIIKIL